MRRASGVACTALTLFFCAHIVVQANEVRAGVAREMLVLPRHVPLAGYSRRKGKPSSGVHDPVGVRALVVSDGATTAALVSSDLLIVDERLFEAVRSRLMAQGLPQNTVLILAATHTHSGPGAFGTKFLEKISMGHFDPRVFEAIVNATTQAVLHAQATQRPTRVVYQRTMTEGLVVNRMDRTGFADAELITSAFYPEQSNVPFAIVVNFSAHPTSLGSWNTELSADYPGVVMKEVERLVPGSLCFFFAGSVGDQAPVKSGTGFEQAEHLGVPLAQHVAAMLQDAAPKRPEGLRAHQAFLRLPSATVRLGSRLTLPRWMGTRLVDDDATLSTVAIGTTVFIGVPCDLSASLGAQLKEASRARGLNPVIVGFASDYIGYCMPEAVYRTQQYESLMAFNGPKTGELIVERLIQMIHD